MPILVLEHSDHARCGRLASTLRDHGHRLEIRRLHAGESVPSDLEGIDGVISTGGPMSPNDDTHAWMQPELDLLAQAVNMDLPIMGICLGCQLLARALGGSVEERPTGQRIGWHDIDLTPQGREDTLLAGLPWSWAQVHWNRWQVGSLPEGACLLATGPDNDVQAWRQGVRTYAFQCHPEIVPGTIQQWIEEEPHLLEQAGMTAAGLMEETQSHWPSFERLTDRLFKSCAMLLFPLEQRTMGLGTIREIHH